MQWLVKVALFVWLFPFIHIPKDTKLLSSVSFLETLRYYYKIMCVDKQLEGSNPSPSEKFTSLHNTSINIAHRGLISPFVSLTFEKFTF